jgi:hypothetical protein
MSDTTKPGDPADKAADGAFGGVTSHRAGYGDRLARVEDWVRRHPTATLTSGEGAVLLVEIDRLREQLRLTHIEAINEAAENADLRAAVERVRALHIRHKCKNCPVCEPECVECGAVYPCPTLRAVEDDA